MLELRTPNSEKSIAMATNVRIQAKRAINAPTRDPITPAPIEQRKAAKAKPHTIGCKTMVCVRPSAVSVPIRLKAPPSKLSMTTAGLYPICLPVQ